MFSVRLIKHMIATKDSAKEHFSQLWYFHQATLPRDLVSIVSFKLFLDYKTSQLFGHVVSSFFSLFFPFLFSFFYHSPSKEITALARIFPLTWRCVILSPLDSLAYFLISCRVTTGGCLSSKRWSVSPQDHRCLAARLWEVRGSLESSETISVTDMSVGVRSCSQRNSF